MARRLGTRRRNLKRHEPHPGLAFSALDSQGTPDSTNYSPGFANESLRDKSTPDPPDLASPLFPRLDRLPFIISSSPGVLITRLQDGKREDR